MASKYPSRQELEEGIKKELQEIKAYVDEYYAKVGQPDFFVATAGVPTTIAAFLQGMSYDTYDKKRINGFNVNFFDCEKALKELLELSFEERAKYVGVGREDLIISGIMIYASFFRLFDFETSVIIDDGLREGLAIKSCKH
jgi:exopolyphosphatase/guanosine-5'-triphosphate,3'-diphosphate pyrophosphatase